MGAKQEVSLFHA